jgi:hypothetical protein
MNSVVLAVNLFDRDKSDKNNDYISCDFDLNFFFNYYISSFLLYMTNINYYYIVFILLFYYNFIYKSY